MKPMAFNLSGAKKVAADEGSSTFSLKNGHQIRVSHAALSPEHVEKIKKLPLYKAGGGNEATADPYPMPSSTPASAGGTSAAWGTEDSSKLNPESPQSAPAQEQSDPAQTQSTPATDSTPDSEPSKPNIDVGAAWNYMFGPKDEPKNEANSTPAPVQAPASSAPISAPPNATTAKQGAADKLNIGNAYGLEASGLHGKATAEANLATNQAAVEADNQYKLKLAQSDWNKSLATMNGHIDTALGDYAKGHIKPNQYLETMDAGPKIANAIGLFLGGWSSAYTHQGNPALDFLNKQIDRDIEAQKSDQNTKLNVYHGYLAQFKNATVAEDMARATQLGIYASKVKQVGENSVAPMAKANEQILLAQLQRQTIPLILNAHLIQQANAFTGVGGGQAGSEAQYKTILAAAQTINPERYKEMQGMYIPGEGVASRPAAEADRTRLSNMNELSPLIDKAIADQSMFGGLGAWSVKNRADAASDRDAIQVSLNKLTGLNRLNDREYVNYGQQVGNIGGVNMGGTIETLKNLRAQLESDKNSARKSMGITPFAGAQQASGLNQQQQQVLMYAQTAYPHASQGDLIKALRTQGKI